MTFAEWLQNELNKRGWSQGDLVRYIRKSGHKISRSQISHILNSDRQATGEVCIAIADGLGLSRQEVFQARGWLPYELENLNLKLSSETVLVAHEIDQLPEPLRRAVLQGAKATADALREQMGA